MNEVITISKGFCENIIVVGDFNINLKVKTNNKFIEYMKSFGLRLNNSLNRDSTNAKTQIDCCFTNIKGIKSDYFESLTSFHKPIWIRKHEGLTKSHFDETEDIHTDIFFDTDDAIIDDQFDAMEVDKNQQIDLDMSFQLEDLKVNDPFDMIEIEKQYFPEDYKLIDSKSRKILNHFVCALEFDNITDSNQISSQAQIINDFIKKLPCITMNNRDKSVQLKLGTEYSIQAFDLVYARTYTIADGLFPKTLYSITLSI
ncbi:unnamed protein product [Adineta steineri]|uniref:Endonuclease/exonuclease/phosphatase domain-containing protein n=1 Tax=Adineta steineri TaxID=433720 RepID=A0A819JGN8_9BILA|nr:unnamed protein product [Adineta steineri]CAF3933526.1 unnamed protein product [Adineta steineri]